MTRRSSEPCGAGSVHSALNQAASAPEFLDRGQFNPESFEGDLLERIEVEANDQKSSVRAFVVTEAPMSGQRDSPARIGNSSPGLPGSPLPLSDRPSGPRPSD